MKDIVEISPLEFEPDSRGIGYFYYDNFLKYSERVAQIDGETGKSDTYADLLKRCVQTAIYLKKLNVKKNDFISICSFNHFDACTPLVASFFINAVTSAVDPTLSSTDIAVLLKQTKPKVIFVACEEVVKIETVIQSLGYAPIVVVFGDTQKHIQFSDILRGDESEIENFSPTAVENLQETALVWFDSGSLGPFKPAAHSHYGLMYSYANNVRTGCNFVLLFGFHTPHWALFSHGLGTCALQGTARLILPKFDHLNPWEPFCHNVTTAVLNVFQAVSLLAVDKPDGLNTSSLSTIVVTGDTVHNEQLMKLRDLFPGTVVTNAYGQCEVAGYLTQFRLSNLSDVELCLEKFGSVGTGLPGCLYKIVDLETGQVLRPYRKGELRVKSKSQLNCYYGMETDDLFDGEGWLRTGDVGYYDEDLCFYIVGRLKEIFKCREFYVIPAILESILLQHHAIEMAVVMEVRHEVDGHWPAAVVVLDPKYKNVTEDDIHNFINSRVQDEERLKGGLIIVDSLPVTVFGKIHKSKIKELYTEEFEKMIQQR